jgi:hypothetical protein
MRFKSRRNKISHTWKGEKLWLQTENKCLSKMGQFQGDLPGESGRRGFRLE